MHAITITREQIEAWAGRPLTDLEVDVLDDAIPHSSIPEAVGVIVDSLDSETYEARASELIPGMIFRAHSEDDWHRVMQRYDHGVAVLIRDRDDTEFGLNMDAVVEVIR